MIAVLVCTILLGSGVSISIYHADSELEQCSGKDMLYQEENLGLQTQKYSADQFTAKFSNRHVPPVYSKSIDCDYSIDLVLKDSSNFLATSKTKDKINQKIKITAITSEI